ncbi:hypothetical protein EST38_g7375 [Candolleomyces aberdarensis]|uniref:Uncharacterized protein n=1 Tax=Candolleomyces aberdarensis TaxID=2316362 RepID=A0A4Q2DF99_9AGAR|nr:hypothetical protein EST38_g7375 [Candolleomyces aberdarensis]
MSSRPLFALIIGIDDYTEKTGLPGLKGAVADADRVQRWISTRFHGAQIQTLRNSEAKRDAIIRALKDLSTNSAIEHDDPILIFYAGHGTEGDAPKEWCWDSQKIQMIVPWDYGHSVDPGHTVVEGIPDCTLGALLRKLANEKGNNITVILDCCHSGSGTRSDSDTRVRGGLRVEAIPPNLDQDLFGNDNTRGVGVRYKFRHHGLSSHVLLAACAPNEEAKEHGSSGAFTRALLKVLDQDNVDTAEMTYKDLIDSIELLPGQTPQCEANDKNRFLFDSKISDKKPFWRAKSKDQQLTIVGAGACYGTSIGSTFAVWRSREDVQKPPLTTVVVNIVKPHESMAPFEMKFSARSFVAQIKKNPTPQLSIYAPEVIQNMDCFKASISGTKDLPPPSVSVTRNKALACIGFTYLDEHDEIGFEPLNPEERQQKIPHTIPATADDLRRALRHLCHYYYHRDRVNRSPPVVGAEDKVPFSSKFTLGLFKLQENEEEKYVEKGQNLNIAATGVELIIGPDNEDDSYGFKITNNTDFPVFPYLFYFDSSNFSITSIYQPVAATKTEAEDSTNFSLRRNEFLTIGYGSAGGIPHSFAISNPDLDQEQGYIRLFLSGRPVDLSHLEQGKISVQARGLLSNLKKFRKPPTLWDVITIPVVLKREEMIGIIGSRNDGKSAFIDRLFESLYGKKTPEPSFETQFIKEYNITLPKPERSFVLVDLPGFQGSNIEDHATALQDLVEYLGTQYNNGRRFKSLVWCYKISKPKFMAIDELNVNLVKDIVGPSGLKNLVALTTDWNNGAGVATNVAARTRAVAGVVSPLYRYESMENHLKSRFKGVEFKRFGTFKPSDPAGRERMLGSASAEDPLKLIRSLLQSKGTEKLQVQHEVCKARTVAGTTAGRRLRDRFEAEIKKKEELIQALDTELEELDEHDKKQSEIQGEKRSAESDIAQWKGFLEDIDSKTVV